MRKRLPQDEFPTKALKREIKKRPRMKMHGAGLKKASRNIIGKILKIRKPH